jgi:hypothetical protein
VRRRSFLSETVYVSLNVALAIVLVATIWWTNSLVLAFILILVSKWRLFAVRPRFWFAHLQANMVDLIVSISFVTELFTINNAGLSTANTWGLLGFLTALYIAWLLFLKPRSSRKYVVAQAGVALFFGSATLFMSSFDWPATAVVIGMWIIGYASARHVLMTYDDESYILFLSLVWGFVLAEIGWIGYHWTVAYSVPFTQGLLWPQISLVLLCLGFVAQRAYDSFYHHQKVRLVDVLLPTIFTVCVAVALFVIIPLIYSLTQCHGLSITCGIAN